MQRRVRSPSRVLVIKEIETAIREADLCSFPWSPTKRHDYDLDEKD